MEMDDPSEYEALLSASDYARRMADDLPGR